MTSQGEDRPLLFATEATRSQGCDHNNGFLLAVFPAVF